MINSPFKRPLHLSPQAVWPVTPGIMYATVLCVFLFIPLKLGGH